MDQNASQIFLEEQVTYASFGRRFAALLIDLLVLAIPVTLADNATNDYLSFGIGHYEWSRLNLLTMTIGWLYSALQESGPYQATIGKRAMGIIVTSEHGGRITFGQATAREFSKYLSGFILLIGYLMVLWDARRQALHDKIARTCVVKGKLKLSRN